MTTVIHLSKIVRLLRYAKRIFLTADTIHVLKNNPTIESGLNILELKHVKRLV